MKPYLILVLFCFLLFPPVVCKAGDVELALSQAVEAYNARNYALAAEKAQIVLTKDPDNTYASFLLGVIASLQNNFSEAVLHLEKAMKGNPPEGTDELLHCAYISSGRSDLALPYFEKRAKLNPENEYISLQYAKALQYTGNDVDAIAIYQRLATGNSENANAAKYQMAEIYLQRREYSEAKRLYDGIDATSAYASSARKMSSDLAETMRIFKLYFSAKYFYNDNPKNISSYYSVKPPHSDGIELSLQLNSRDFYLSKKILARFQSLYTGTYYFKNDMSDSEYESISITPLYLSYLLTDSTSLNLMGSAIFDRIDRQNYSTGYSGSIGLVHGYGKGNSFNFFLNVADRDYTTHYDYLGGRLNYGYMDGQLYSATCDWLPLSSYYTPISMGFHYAYGYFDAENTNDAIYGLYAKGVEYQDHAVSTDIYWPLKGPFSRFAVLANAKYSLRYYSNTSFSYLDAIGKKIESQTFSGGGAIQVMLHEKYNLLFDIGADYTTTDSNSKYLEYDATTYFVRLSARY